MFKRIVQMACVGLISITPAFAENYVQQADEEWRSFIEPLLPLGAELAKSFPASEDPQVRAEMFRFMYSNLGAGFMQLVYASPKHPDFVPNWSQVFNNGGNLNPDNVYQFTPIDDDGVYKISGFRGSVHIVDFQIGASPLFSYGKANADKSFGPTLANYDIDDMTIAENGAFEFVLSATKPEGYTGDWRQLPANSDYLLVRQLAYDWLNEVDARLAVERLDTPAARPRQTAEEISTALKFVPEWVERWVKMGIGPREGARPWGEVWQTKDKIVLIDFTHDQGGRATQLYIAGQFELKENEAMLVEMSPGECRFWNMHLGSEMLNTMDFMNRQVSLNGHLAKADPDGTLRIVISAQDPGVPNWLDNMGYKAGYIWGRLDTCENNDTPVVKKINVADVRQYLPKETPVVTAEQREADIRLRRKGAQLRRRW